MAYKLSAELLIHPDHKFHTPLWLFFKLHVGISWGEILTCKMLTKKRMITELQNSKMVTAIYIFVTSDYVHFC